MRSFDYAQDDKDKIIVMLSRPLGRVETSKPKAINYINHVNKDGDPSAALRMTNNKADREKIIVMLSRPEPNTVMLSRPLGRVETS